MSLTPARRLLLERMPERDWRQWTLDYARLRHWLAYFTWSSRHSPEGFPDLVLCRPPRLVLAELKSQRGRLTVEQQGWQDALSRVTEISNHVWRPTDMPIVEGLLR